MTRVESILVQVSDLSPDERKELLRLLSVQAFGARADDETAAAQEVAVGKRGLAAWTDSTRSEDWSKFYPDVLRNGGWANA